MCGPQIEIAVVHRSTIIYHSWWRHNASFSGNPTRTRRSLACTSPERRGRHGGIELCAAHTGTIADISLCGLHHITLTIVVRWWLYAISTYYSAHPFIIDGKTFSHFLSLYLTLGCIHNVSNVVYERLTYSKGVKFRRITRIEFYDHIYKLLSCTLLFQIFYLATCHVNTLICDKTEHTLQ